MTGAVEDRFEEAERLRDYFEVQLLFAETLAARTARTLSDACLEFTNLHRRFGLGRAVGGVVHPEWTRYAHGLEQRASGLDRLDWTVAFLRDAPSEKSDTRRFGCFSHELLPDGVVRIHFNNRDSDDRCGPLARAKIGRRLSDLQEMFGFIRERHPAARTVRGGSWLYNLEAYRRLFPPEYAASIFEPERVRLDGTSSWGQLLDFRGCVKPAVRQAVLDNIRNVDVAAPRTAFPLRALGAESAIEPFYRLYGCERIIERG